MDPDEFNDFEEAPPAQDGTHLPPQEEASDPSLDPVPAQLAVESSMPDTSIQASYSMMNNFPSEQSEGKESQGWQESVWPSMGKMESDHLAEVEPMEVDFSKRKSEGEIQPHPTDYPNAPELTEVSNEMESNISNAGTLSSQVNDDFDWAISATKEPQENSQGPSNLLQKKEDDIYVFSAAEEAVPQEQKTIQTREKTQAVDPLNQDDEFDDFTQEEARKQSDEFVQAEITQTTQYEQVQKTVEDYSEAVATANQAEPEDKGQVGVAKEKDEGLVEQSEQVDTKPVVQVPVMDETKPAETIQVQEDQDDQFGDFEETVPTDPAKQPEETGPVLSPPPPQERHIDDRVEVIPQKMGLGADIGQKQQQLQHFVDSLPDYSFLLAEGFKSM